MSIKCSNKKCGHTNPDGYSYCVKCGQLLGGKQEKIVVIKSDYDKMDAKLKDITKKGLAPAGYELISKAALEEERKNVLAQVSNLKKELDDIKKKGFAPEGFRLVADITRPERRRSNSDFLDRIDFDDMKPKNTDAKIWEIAKDEVLKERSFDFSFMKLKPEDRLKLLREDLKDKIDDTAAHIKKLDFDDSKHKVTRQKTLSNSEYNDLVRRAGQTWWQRLWDSLKSK